MTTAQTLKYLTRVRVPLDDGITKIGTRLAVWSDRNGGGRGVPPGIVREIAC